MVAVANRDLWISVRGSARILGVTPQSAARVLAAAGSNVRRKVLPGMDSKFYRPDVEALAASCVSAGAPLTDAGGEATRRAATPRTC